MLLNYLNHNTVVDHIVSEANNPASEASLANFGAKRKFLLVFIKTSNFEKYLIECNIFTNMFDFPKNSILCRFCDLNMIKSGKLPQCC